MPLPALSKPCRPIRLRSCLLALALVCSAIFALPAQAYRLSPIVMDFEPAGRGAVRNFEVFNDAAESVPVEIRIVSRTMAEDGTEIYGSDDDDFVVFPPQMTLAPNQTQVVQVRWIGAADPEQELAYRIIAEQLPVELDATAAPGAAIRLLVRYEGSLYIVPDQATADIQIESLARVNTVADGELLELVLANHGKAHGIIHEAFLSLRDSTGKRIDLAPEQLAKLDNTNILAGGKRRYLLALPRGVDIADGELRAVFQSATTR